jgi:hypothetical protein
VPNRYPDWPPSLQGQCRQFDCISRLATLVYQQSSSAPFFRAPNVCRARTVALTTLHCHDWNLSEESAFRLTSISPVSSLQ